MIQRYNRNQIIKIVLCVVGGLLCCALSFLFFYWVPEWVAGLAGFQVPPSFLQGMGVFGLAVTWISGIRVWQAKGGLYGYHESGLYHDLGTDTAGATVVDFYAHRVTGPAYMLGQIFLAGPLWLLNCFTLYRSLIPNSPELESDLERVLAKLKVANQWQGISEYPDDETEILYLAQMELIDFSAHKGSPRIKAS